jgi:hypothetical protein
MPTLSNKAPLRKSSKKTIFRNPQGTIPRSFSPWKGGVE